MNLRRLLPALFVGTWMLGPAAAQEVIRGAEPIPMPATAFLEKDYCLQERQWAERCLLEPAQKKWQGQPWADEAAKLVQETFQLQELENAPIANLAGLAPRFRSLLEKAPDEPLVCLLAACAFYDERRNWRDSQPALDRLLAVNNLPSVVESQALQILMPRLWERGQDRMGVYHRLLRAILRSISDGSYDPEAEAVFVRHQIDAIETAGVQYMPWFTDYKAAIRQSKWSEWVKLTLEGYAETEMAWVGRTGKWADEVKDEQWQQFNDHLKIARELLTRAHELRPDRPEAAAQMIPVAMGDGTQETRLWFDRAVSAQFDYMPAYGSLLLAYRPRWGGDYDLMIAFGKACVATKRYDTAIPLRFMGACIDIGTEDGMPSTVCKNPLARAPLLEIARGYLNAKEVPPQTRHMRVSNAALCAWLANDSALALSALKEAGGRLHPIAIHYLNSMLLHEDMLRLEASASAGVFGDAIRAAATPVEGKSRQVFAEELAKIPVEGLSDEAKNYLAEGRDLLAFDDAFASGKWVPVKPRPGLTNFYQTGGRWTVESDGALVAVGDDGRARQIAFRLPLEDDLEMRGEITFEIPEGDAPVDTFGFGPMLQWTPTTEGESQGGTRFMLLNEGGQGKARLVTRKWGKDGSGERLKFELNNTFKARVVEKKLSFEINGQSIATDVPQESIGMENEGGFLGFAAYRLPWGAKARVTALEVRKLDAATVAAEDKAKATEAKKVEDKPKSSKSTKVSKKSLAAPSVPVAEIPSPPNYKLYWQIGLLVLLLLAASFVPKFIKAKQE